MAGNQLNESEIAKKPDMVGESRTETHGSGAETNRLSQQFMDEIFSRNKESKVSDQGKSTNAFSDELHKLQLTDNKGGAKADAPVVERTAAIVPPRPEMNQGGMVPPHLEIVKPVSLPKPGEVVPQVQPEPRRDVAPQQVQAPQANDLQIGNHSYHMGLGPNGQTGDLSVSSADGASKLQLTRDASGALTVASATGEFQPNNGRINIDGIPLAVGPDGKIIGDISFDSKGNIKYKQTDVPYKIEFDRKADGTLQAFDFKNWKRTTTTPDGQTKDDYWDGFSWRQGQMAADGKRIDFLPPDPIKVSYVIRDTSNGQDLATVNFPYGMSWNCNFREHSMVKQYAAGSDGAQGENYKLYYDGNSYREASQVNKDQPKPGDTTVAFKEPQPNGPKSATYHQDGSVTTLRADNTIVEQDQNGFVTAVNGPRGNWQFNRDVNGDVMQAMHSYPGADGNMVSEVFTRSGLEQNPGMDYWYSRAGYNDPRMPSDRPPFDLNQPAGINTFIDANGNVVNMNLNVSADGTVRTYMAGADNNGPIISYQQPGQDRYQDTGTTLVSQLPGGVIDTIDKKTQDHTLTFTRGGKSYSLNSKDGDCQVLPDGTVIQDHPGQQATRDCYFANGVVSMVANDSSNPPKAVTKIAQIPQKNGQFMTLKNGENGISELNVLDDGQVAATVTGANNAVMMTVFNPADGSRAEKAKDATYWRVTDSEGAFAGNELYPGQAVWKIGAAGISGPNGITYDSANWAPAQPAVGPNGELLLAGVGNKAGLTASLDLGGVAMEHSGNVDVYNYPDKTSARFENGKLAAMGSNGQMFRVDAADAEQGPVNGIVDASGQTLAPLPAGVAYHFDKQTGKFVSQVSNNNGVQMVTIWDPTTNTYTMKRGWTAKGQPMNLSVTLNNQNRVVQFALPGMPATNVDGNAKVKSASVDPSSTSFSVEMADGSAGRFNQDGSYEWMNPGTQLARFNKDGVRVDANGKALA